MNHFLHAKADERSRSHRPGLASHSSVPVNPMTSLCGTSYRTAWFMAAGWWWAVSRYRSWIHTLPMERLKVTWSIFTQKHTQETASNLGNRATRTLPADTEPATVNLEESTNKTCDCFLDDYAQSCHFLSKINEKPPLVTFRGEKTHDRIRYVKVCGRCRETQ